MHGTTTTAPAVHAAGRRHAAPLPCPCPALTGGDDAYRALIQRLNHRIQPPAVRAVGLYLHKQLLPPPRPALGRPERSRSHRRAALCWTSCTCVYFGGHRCMRRQAAAQAGSRLLPRAALQSAAG